MNGATIRSEEREKIPGSSTGADATVRTRRPEIGGGPQGGASISGHLSGGNAPRSASSHNSSDVAVLCNISEQSWLLHRTHGTFAVVGRNSDESYALTGVTSRTGTMDLGDKRTLEFAIPAREIAEDLAREINSDAGEGSYFGVFACAGTLPTENELREAREKLEVFYRSLVAGADRQWERTHNVVLISDLERRAAKELHLEKEWCYEPQQRMDCPACGEKLKPGVAVCRVCGAVLDKEKAAKFGLVAAAPIIAQPVARPEGRKQLGNEQARYGTSR
jgi:hypothetical protein